MKNITKGFTLIELLIVIALLGALAVALLAALDPLEQIKKGTDTGVRNTVSEIANSFIRYASIKQGLFPYSGTITWASVGTDTAGVAYSAVSEVINTGELKTDFISLSKESLNKIFIMGDQQKTYVCFAPSAKAFRVDPNTKFVTASSVSMTEVTSCGIDGVVTGAGADAGKTCYWCVR